MALLPKSLEASTPKLFLSLEAVIVAVNYPNAKPDDLADSCFTYTFKLSFS